MKDFRLKFSKKEDMVYISHLDLMRLFQRVFRRSGIMLKHTEGFNPQPKIAFATALALGTESDAEYMDIELEKEIGLNELVEKLNENLPAGIHILKASEREDKASIMSLIEWGSYEVIAKLRWASTEDKAFTEINNFLNRKEIIDIREKKKKNKMVVREVNIRELIKKLEITGIDETSISFSMFLKTGSNGNLKPEIVINKLAEYTDLGIDAELPKVLRKELYIEENGNIVEPL